MTEILFDLKSGCSINTAREIMGENLFFGPEEINRKITIISPINLQIPFDEQELRSYRAFNCSLIYRSAQMKNGRRLTIKNLIKQNPDKHLVHIESRIDHHQRWYYHTQTPREGWSIVSNEVIKGFHNTDLLRQLRTISYLFHRKNIFDIASFDNPIKRAIRQFDKKRNWLKKNIFKEFVLVPKAISRLEMISIFFRRPVEVLYDQIVTGIHQSSGICVWTPTWYEDTFVNVIYMPDGSIGIDRAEPFWYDEDYEYIFCVNKK